MRGSLRWKYPYGSPYVDDECGLRRGAEGHSWLRLVTEPLAVVNEVGVGEVVQLGDALPAIGPKDATQRFATLDNMHATSRCCGSSSSSCRASVGDNVAGIDQIDVAGRHAPRGQRPQPGSFGDAGHGVATAHGHAHAPGGSDGRVCCGSVEPLVDDAHDRPVIRAQRSLAGFAVAVVAADSRGRQRLVVHARRGLRSRSR